jgi:hypothetical protein
VDDVEFQFLVEAHQPDEGRESRRSAVPLRPRRRYDERARVLKFHGEFARVVQTHDHGVVALRIEAPKVVQRLTFRPGQPGVGDDECDVEQGAFSHEIDARDGRWRRFDAISGGGFPEEAAEVRRPRLDILHP